MFLIRTFSVHCHTALISLPLKSFSLHVSLSKPNCFSLKSLPFSSRSSRHPKMSSKGLAFDVLMSASRAAAKKNPQPSTPKKRKTAGSSAAAPQNPIGSLNPNSEKSPVDQSDAVPEVDGQKISSSEADKPKQSQENLKISKRPNSAEIVDELKSKIHLLKKKATEFDPKKIACWSEGGRVPFIFLALAFELISNESSRIIITDITCNVLRTVMAITPEDLLPTVYLLANKIAPAHEGLELGIGDASIIKALAEAFGRDEQAVKNKYKEKGDLGSVAQGSRQSQSMIFRPDPLTVAKVFDTFLLIAKESGQNSQEKKKNRMKSLLVAATDCEPLYLIRLLQTKLRIKLAEQTLLAALGQASVYAEKHSTPPSGIQSPLEEAAKIVKQVYSVLPMYDKIIPALLSSGVWNLSKTCGFALGVPVGPMLAKPTKNVQEILNKFQNIVCTCEYKYDGERAQIHYMNDGSVEIYSRNAERNTTKFPDVVDAVARYKKESVKSFVLDCELVAYDREKNKILPFQILSTRARKNVVLSEIKVDVCIYAFDMLYLNGQPLLQEELNVRRKRLYESFEEQPGYFQFATAITSNDVEEIQAFLDAAVKASCEGLIVKTLNQDATYEPSKRSNNWLKLKKDYMDSIGDSVDLVPIGAFHGRGKRTGVYGAFLLACYDADNEEFQSISKIGTGFSDSMLEELSESLRSTVIPDAKSYYRFSASIEPHVWFEPTVVWEVKAADLTVSPVYRAAVGMVDPDKGISLRFPRLVRVREDKTPEKATTSEQIAELYNAQQTNQQNNQDENNQQDNQDEVADEDKDA